MTHPNPKVTEYLSNPHMVDDHSTVAAFESGIGRVFNQIKGAVSRGINPSIRVEAGRLIPPPPGYDQFAGKVCSGPGVKRNGFGPKVCGRKAMAILQVAHFEPDFPRSPSAELTDAVLGSFAYGGPNPVPAATGPRMGKMVADPGTIGPDSKFVCYFHSLSRYANVLHPEDNDGKIPEAPGLDEPIIGLENLDIRRQWRCVGSDASFAWVTDGRATVMCSRRDYIRFLADNGILPEFGQPLP